MKKKIDLPKILEEEAKQNYIPTDQYQHKQVPIASEEEDSNNFDILVDFNSIIMNQSKTKPVIRKKEVDQGCNPAKKLSLIVSNKLTLETYMPILTYFEYHNNPQDDSREVIKTFYFLLNNFSQTTKNIQHNILCFMSNKYELIIFYEEDETYKWRRRGKLYINQLASISLEIKIPGDLLTRKKNLNDTIHGFQIFEKEIAIIWNCFANFYTFKAIPFKIYTNFQFYRGRKTEPVLDFSTKIETKQGKTKFCYKWSGVMFPKELREFVKNIQKDLILEDLQIQRFFTIYNKYGEALVK